MLQEGKDTVGMKIGQVVKLYRVKCGLTLAELAVQSDMSVSYLSLIERGRRDLPMSTLYRLANALDVPVFFLVACTEMEKLEAVSPGLGQLLSTEILSTNS